MPQSGLSGRRCRPRSAPDGETLLATAPAEVCLLDDPGCWPHEPAGAAGSHWYPPAHASCGLSRACHHRSRDAPFLAGLHRLTVRMLSERHVTCYPDPVEATGTPS